MGLLENAINLFDNAIALGDDVLDVSTDIIRKVTTVTINGGKFFSRTTMKSNFKLTGKMAAFGKSAKTLGRVTPVIDFGFMVYDVWSGYQYNKNIVHASEEKTNSDIACDIMIDGSIMLIGKIPVGGPIFGGFATVYLDIWEKNGETGRQRLKCDLYTTKWYRNFEENYVESRDINGRPLVIQYGSL